MRFVAALVLYSAALYSVAYPPVAEAALAILPLSQIHAGQRGVGRTVFSGDSIEDFQVEILGILRNTGPKESLILARLSGGPLEHTGVMQGMSGSPVYIEGKLIGAVAMAFPFAKDPVAGIRPIEEMLAVDSLPDTRVKPAIASLFPADSRHQTPASHEDRMTEVATPVSLGGFTSAAVERFAPGLRALGLEPRQSMSLGGGSDETKMGDPSKLKPGSMISVQLMTGDMSVGADGTLTCIDGDRIYAFGHRFLAVGPTELPFTRSEVMTLLANVNTSFKISAAREPMGVISQDRNTAVTGTLGRAAAMLPLDITVAAASGSGFKDVDAYHMKMVNDRFLSPYLLQMAVFSAIDATERAIGAASIAVKGSIEFENGAETASLHNIYAADNGTAMQAATLTAVPLSYLMQGGFEALKIKRIALRIESSNTKKTLNIGQVYLSRREARPGETVELMAVLEGENGAQVTKSVKYRIPPGAPAGTLFFTVADGGQTSIAELRQIISDTPGSPEQMIATVNRLHPSDKTYVRVWRADPAFALQGAEFPDPPPSLALVLGGAQTAQQNRNSKIAEIAIDTGDMMVSGYKTVQLEVKE